VGLLLGEQKDSSIVSVKQVVPRGSADRTNRIRVGDQILRVGDVDATGMGVTDLRNLIIGEQVIHTQTHIYMFVYVCVCACI
jgi:C-terminal processing protease CtpA/Prc